MRITLENWNELVDIFENGAYGDTSIVRSGSGEEAMHFFVDGQDYELSPQNLPAAVARRPSHPDTDYFKDRGARIEERGRG